MTISIVIPIYNVEDYLKQCIASVLNQTYQNIEILLVDDGSTDSSGRICDEYSKKDFRIKVFHKENGGLSDARNFGIERATGEYITFIDSDDVVTETYIEDLYLTLRKYRAKIAVASFAYLYDKEIIPTSLDEVFDIVYSQDEILERLYASKPESSVTYVTAWGKLFERSLFEQIRFPFGKRHEDEFTTYKLYLEVDRVAYLNKPLYLYRQREGSIMAESYNLTRLDALEALEERIAIFKQQEKSTLLTELAYLNLLSMHRYNLKKEGYTEKLDEVKLKYDNQFRKLFPELPLKQKAKELIKRYAYSLVVLKEKIK